MATSKSAPKSVSKTLQSLDPKIKWLAGLALITAVIFVFLKSPTAEKLGINISGMKSDAYELTYPSSGGSGKDAASRVSPSSPAAYYGGATSSCTATACPDSRIKITAPTSETRMGPRKTHKISWTEAEAIESRYHTISVHAIGCGSNCPAPYVIVNKSRGNGFYNWQIGSFLPVPQHFQNVPVWLRVTATGRYDSNGNPTDFYAQVPVVFSATR